MCLSFCPVLGFPAYLMVLLFLGPTYALIFAVVIMSSFIIYKDIQLRRRGQRLWHEPSTDDIENQAHQEHAKSTIRAVDVSSLVLRIVQANDPVVTCEICLDELVAGEEVAGSANSECIHEFHANCIQQALKRRTTCPCCRREYLLTNQTETLPPDDDIEQGSSSSFDPSLHTEENVSMHVVTDQEISMQTDASRPRTANYP